MKRIGVWSGSADPLHNGHLYLIEQGSKLFDEFWVVIGSHPKKNHVWTKEERLTIAKHSCPWPNIKFGILSDKNNIVEFTKEIKRESGDTIALFRGIRNPKDTTYEAGIVYQIRKLTDELPTLFMIPPHNLTNLSSTRIRELAEEQKFGEIESLVPAASLEALHVKYFDMNSLFETTTAGFAPAPAETFCTWSTNNHKMEMQDTLHLAFPDKMLNSSAIGTIRNNFNKLVSLGFVRFPETVMALQVRGMLDPFPYDVVVSDRFLLKRIKIDSVKPLGKRYVPMSQSLGPIIVDANTVMGDDTILGPLGPAIIIEGKHRWLDAKEAGEDTILAYVGEKAWTNHRSLLDPT